MTTIVCIVEGDGDVKALPILLGRIAQAHGVHNLQVPVPVRVHRNRFLNRDDEFRRKLLLAAAKAAGRGRVLILLDADDDCPVTLAADIANRAAAVLPHKPVSVVLANREYETWFLAAIASLSGKRGLGEKLDPPAFSALFDLSQAQAGSRSMRKLVGTVTAAL